MQSRSRPADWKTQLEDVKGRRVVVSGGTTGIGRTVAALLLHHGARVLVFSRERQHVEEAMADLEPLGEVHGMTAHAENEQDLDAVFERADAVLGGLDVMINNAGVAGGTVAEDEPQDFRQVLEINVAGYLSAAHRAIPRLKKTRGTLINIGSMSAQSRNPGSDVYVATKSAIRGWTQSLAQHVCEDGIRVTLIEPGLVGADIHDDEKRQPQRQRELHAQGEMLFSESIAEAVLYVLQQPPECHVPMLQVQPVKRQSL